MSKKEDRKKQELDIVEKAPHYNKGEIEPIDVIEDWGFGEGFYVGSVLKYLCRYRDKGKPIQDLEKARFYLDRLISVVLRSDGGEVKPVEVEDIGVGTSFYVAGSVIQCLHNYRTKENPAQELVEAIAYLGLLIRTVRKEYEGQGD